MSRFRDGHLTRTSQGISAHRVSPGTAVNRPSSCNRFRGHVTEESIQSDIHETSYIDLCDKYLEMIAVC